jgi:hypothetical protein
MNPTSIIKNWKLFNDVVQTSWENLSQSHGVPPQDQHTGTSSMISSLGSTDSLDSVALVSFDDTFFLEDSVALVSFNNAVAHTTLGVALFVADGDLVALAALGGAFFAADVDLVALATDRSYPAKRFTAL